MAHSNNFRTTEGKRRKGVASPLFANPAHRWMVVLVSLLMIVCCLRGFRVDTGFTYLIQFGEEIWGEHQIPEVKEARPYVRKKCSGYDGQFYAQIAIHPLLDAPELTSAIDQPRYRSRRILLPALAYVLGLGRTSWILQAYSLLNILFWFILFWLMARMVRPQTWFAWMCIVLGVMGSTGVLESVRRALTDMPAAVLGLSSVLLFAKRRPAAGCGMLTASVLAKEPMALISAVPLWPPRWKESSYYYLVGGVALAMLVVLAWHVYIRLALPPDLTSLDDIAFSRSNITWPFWGILKAGLEIVALPLEKWRFNDFFFIPAVIASGGQVAFLFIYRKWNDPVWRYGILFAVLFFFLGDKLWFETRPVFRTILPVTIAFFYLLATQPIRRKALWFAIGCAHVPYALINFVTYDLH